METNCKCISWFTLNWFGFFCPCNSKINTFYIPMEKEYKNRSSWKRYNNRCSDSQGNILWILKHWHLLWWKEFLIGHKISMNLQILPTVVWWNICKTSFLSNLSKENPNLTTKIHYCLTIKYVICPEQIVIFFKFPVSRNDNEHFICVQTNITYSKVTNRNESSLNQIEFLNSIKLIQISCQYRFGDGY